jgi:hypothetical protein
MSAKDKPLHARAKTMIKQVDAILWTFWNPISCGVPEDEYTSYAPVVARMVLEDRPVEELAGHLSRIREEAMGLGPNEYADHAVAVRLKALIIIE